MATFEDKLGRLEELTDQITSSSISLEDALSAFEEGIKLTKEMKKEIEKIESKIQILTKEPVTDQSGKVVDSGLELFSQNEEINGTRK